MPFQEGTWESKVQKSTTVQLVLAIVILVLLIAFSVSAYEVHKVFAATDAASTKSKFSVAAAEEAKAFWQMGAY